jgi:hypothetical protein
MPQKSCSLDRQLAQERQSLGGFYDACLATYHLPVQCRQHAADVAYSFGRSVKSLARLRSVGQSSLNGIELLLVDLPLCAETKQQSRETRVAAESTAGKASAGAIAQLIAHTTLIDARTHQ